MKLLGFIFHAKIGPSLVLTAVHLETTCMPESLLPH